MSGFGVGDLIPSGTLSLALNTVYLGTFVCIYVLRAYDIEYASWRSLFIVLIVGSQHCVIVLTLLCVHLAAYGRLWRPIACQSGHSERRLEPHVCVMDASDRILAVPRQWYLIEWCSHHWVLLATRRRVSQTRIVARSRFSLYLFFTNNCHFLRLRSKNQGNFTYATDTHGSWSCSKLGIMLAWVCWEELVVDKKL